MQEEDGGIREQKYQFDLVVKYNIMFVVFFILHIYLICCNTCLQKDNVKLWLVWNVLIIDKKKPISKVLVASNCQPKNLGIVWLPYVWYSNHLTISVTTMCVV